MLLWILFAVLTAAVVGAVAAPMVRHGSDTAPASADDADAAVYRDLLEEIELDRANGTIDDAAADSARAEVGRRLLSIAERDGVDASRVKADAASKNDVATGSYPVGVFAARVAAAIAAVVTLGSLALYLVTGSPGVPGHAKRAAPVPSAEQSDIEALVSEVEARLRFAPQDGAGWDVIAPVYFRLKRFDDAQVAYRRAIELLGPTVKRLRGLGLSEIRVSKGEITPVARQVYEKILAVDPKDVAARLWIARAFEQDGESEAAVGAYRQMLELGDKDGKWRPLVEKRIAELTSGEAVSNPTGRVRGVGPADAEAVRGMSDEERARFISGMVERLAERVAQDGSDFDAWLQLVRAYAVLGRREDANKVLADARKRFGGNEAQMGALEDLARQFQLGS